MGSIILKLWAKRSKIIQRSDAICQPALPLLYQASFEVYGERLNWLNQKLFVCPATRLPDQVILGYYTAETD